MQTDRASTDERSAKLWRSLSAGLRHPRPWRSFAAILPLGLLQAGGMIPAVEAADQAIHSNTFWVVLATLLGAGCIYYLARWWQERLVRQQQANLNSLYELAEAQLLADTGGVPKQVAEVAALTADASHASVLILNPGAQQLEYVAATDPPPLPAVSLSAISGAVTCLRNEALTEVPDAENCPFVKKETVRRLGQKSLLYVPIKAGGQCFGVIEIEDRQRKRVFSQEQKARVEHIAKLVALGLRLRDRESVNDQLHQTEKLAALSELIEGLAREVGEPLSKVQALTGEVTEESEAGVLAARLAAIDQEVRQASETLERLVQLARMRRGSPEQVDLNRLIEGLAERVRDLWDEQGLRLNLELSKTPPRISAAPSHLEEVFLNLVLYAEHLLKNSGGTTLRIGTNLLERQALLSILPEGVPQLASATAAPAPRNGLPAAAALRLSVCRNLIEGYGGTLQIHEEATGGFSIEIEYPLVEEGRSVLPPSANQDRSAGRSGSPLTALVVDSDPEFQEALLYQLSDRGYRVVPVASEEEGLDLCQQTRFELVFCEVRVGRMSGLKIYQRVRSEVGRFVFLVDRNVPADSIELLTGEGQAVLSKPLQEGDLESVLGSVEPESVEVSEGNTAKV